MCSRRCHFLTLLHENALKCPINYEILLAIATLDMADKSASTARTSTQRAAIDAVDSILSRRIRWFRSHDLRVQLKLQRDGWRRSRASSSRRCDELWKMWQSNVPLVILA
jgi:hypothetical protein